jgi:hypothetical protein
MPLPRAPVLDQSSSIMNGGNRPLQLLCLNISGFLCREASRRRHYLMSSWRLYTLIESPEPRSLWGSFQEFGAFACLAALRTTG